MLPICPDCRRTESLLASLSNAILDAKEDLFDGTFTHLYPHESNIRLCALSSRDFDRLVAAYPANDDVRRAALSRLRSPFKRKLA